MAISPTSGVPAQRAQNAIAPATERVGRSLERLASGRRLNKALDDAAGLAIADRLSRDRAVTAQAVRNASDGVSAMRIAEGALQQVGAITGRIAELASQAASGLVSDAQRATIQQEVSQLQAEVDRIAATTTFNGQALFAGQPTTVFAGISADPGSLVTLPGSEASASALGLDAIDVSTQAGAQAAFAAIDGAGTALAERQAALGATSAQLGSVIDQLRTSAEQLAGAESRIRDADVAVEAAELAAATIRQQLGVAAAAQSNVSARDAVALLR